ncbi:MAG TPA: STAS domain-containing protein [Acidimicrobiales bacterium]|jgi:anti-sigma B factor antagonist|nr:STAS domain-containing protein [Acidimicrobiales bacterium]
MEETRDSGVGAATVVQMPGAVVLQLHGNIDRTATDALTTAYERGVAEQSGDGGRARVVLDFTDADYINSSGIAIVVSVLARARGEGRAVAATGLTEHYRHIFDITRLSDFMEVCPDLDTAVGSSIGSY